MKNKIFKLTHICFLFFFSINVSASDQFNFDITEVQILDKGNKFVGLNRGEITSNNGIKIESDQFEYIKNRNLLTAIGNVKITDSIRNYIIFSDQVIFKKNENLILTKNKSKALSLNDNIDIEAKNFIYDRDKNIISGEKNVIVRDKINNIKIFSEFASYERDLEKIYTKGKTSGIIDLKYNFETEDLFFYKNLMEVSSENHTKIYDNSNLYQLEKFKYLIDNYELKGENLLISSNYKLPNNDKFYFSSAIININSLDFVAKDTEIKIHKSIFNDPNNDPRLKGVSSVKKGNLTTVQKGIFTSCAKNDDCPPWSIQADKIIHDKKNKKLIYDNATLKLYNIPVFYFPKFFHPDPTVKRQSGFLKPQLNKSNIFGNTLNIPYFHVLSENKDFTLNPIISNSGTNSLQAEFRQENKNSSFIADMGFVNNFKSNYSNTKKNIMHFFAKSKIDLDLEDFDDSELNIFVEKTNKDTYLKIFDNYLINNDVKPKNKNTLSSGIDLVLNNENYSLNTGFSAYEDLNKKQNDRYQFILPYFNFDKSLENKLGKINLNSSGDNTLQNTNNLRTKIVNDINFSTNELLSSKTGLTSNFNIYFKNVNTLAKEDEVYKSSPQSELMNLIEYNTSLPLIKNTNKKTEVLIPKISLRVNPSDMKNHSETNRKINTSNIFSLNRLGLQDSLESGKSITFGLDYSNTNNVNNNEINAKIATVLRDDKENTIPKKTTLDKKKSYLFGSVSYDTDDILNIDYNFAIDENLDEIKYHGLGINLSLNNFVTDFNFIEESGVIGSANIIENKSTLKFNENNLLTFKTRRNEEINLTEYYDLIYEYKNDCLVAGLKFKKTFYQDRDIEPSEDLFFYITLIPLTTLEQEIDESF